MSKQRLNLMLISSLLKPFETAGIQNKEGRTLIKSSPF
jgi:hypothetical protein